MGARLFKVRLLPANNFMVNPQTKNPQTENRWLETSGKLPMDLGIPTLNIKNLLESNRLSSRYLVRGLAVHEPWPCTPAAEAAVHPLIWCSESSSSQGCLSGGVFFSQTLVTSLLQSHAQHVGRAIKSSHFADWAYTLLNESYGDVPNVALIRRGNQWQ